MLFSLPHFPTRALRLRALLLTLGVVLVSPLRTFALPAELADLAELADSKGALLPEAPALGTGVLQDVAPDPQAASTASPQPLSSSAQTPPAPASVDETAAQKAERERSEAQLKKEEKQRILGVLPNFNITYDQNVPPLSPGQKFRLAFRSAIDPVQFGVAAVLAGYGQATDDHEGYGQGAEGYAKRFGAQYADNFDGTMIGNALLPVILKEDPRYFRRGTGTIRRRVLYSISTTVWCKRDNGKWGPNYANVLGNIAAGGISNAYYPASDRGAGLVFSNALTVTAEGCWVGCRMSFCRI